MNSGANWNLYNQTKEKISLLNICTEDLKEIAKSINTK